MSKIIVCKSHKLVDITKQYCAFYMESIEDDRPIGYGSTVEEAVKNLRENINEYHQI